MPPVQASPIYSILHAMDSVIRTTEPEFDEAYSEVIHMSSMRRPVSVKRFLFFSVFFCFFLFFSFLLYSFSKLFPWGRATSVATLPSALFVER